jgi:hypothetical protein
MGGRLDNINGILPLPALFSRKLRKPASFHQILLEPAFDLFKAGAGGNRECFSTS